MKTKRIISLIIAIFFVFATFASCYFIFSIKKMQCKVISDGEISSHLIQEDLDEYLGKSILFFDLENVENVIKNYPYFKLNSVYKKYPNIIQIEIEQRKEVYHILHSDNLYYLLDQTGFVIDALTSVEFESSNLNTIELSYKNDESFALAIGKKVSVSQIQLFNSVLEMTKSIDLTDCVYKIEVNAHSQFKDVVFFTRSGVKIEITSADILGLQKLDVAMQSYHNAKDYYKTFDTIKVFILVDDNSIQCEWTSWNEGV